MNRQPTGAGHRTGRRDRTSGNRRAPVRRRRLPLWLALVCGCLCLPAAAGAQDDAATGDLAALRGAIRANRLTDLQTILRDQPEVLRHTDQGGRSPLHWSMDCRASIVRELLRHPIAVDSPDAQSWRPLHLAAEGGRADLIELLLAKGADVDAPATPERQTPLYIAAEFGYTAAVRALLLAHAAPSLQNQAGATAAHRAARHGDVDVLSLLIAAKTDLTLRDKAGKTILDEAIAHRQSAAIALLVARNAAHSLPLPANLPPPAIPATPTNPATPATPVAAGKADPNAQLDPDLETQMLAACSAGDGDKMRELLKMDINLAYATVQSGSSKGYFALQKLASKGTPEMAQQLLDLGVPVDLRKEGARTPLQLSAMSGNLELVKFLVNKGADVNAVEKWFGWTPLFMACYMGDSQKYQDIAKYLIEHKADMSIKDLKLKMTPLGAAKLKNHPAMIKILEAAGAPE